jgi:protein TonB
MISKKNPKISLENKKAMFFQIGLAITLIVVLIAFEWKSYDKSNYNLGNLNLDDMEEEIIPITRQEVKPPPPPPPPPEIIEIVEDEVEIEKELEIEETETDEDEIVEIEEDDEEFFMVVENMPEFPGGDLALMKFIQKNVKYPAIAKEYNITGKVYVSFIVDKLGKVTNVKIVRGVDKNLDAEALRVVSLLPKYKPGKQRGKSVRVMFTIPINFTLN